MAEPCIISEKQADAQSLINWRSDGDDSSR
jgi:hypothetical protein